MVKLLLIGVGGALGALMRYGLSVSVISLTGTGFPLATLIVNISGSAAMGLLYEFSMERGSFSPELRSMLLVGLLGAFTTFSTFSLETLGLLENGEVFKALANIALSVMLCLLACWAGLLLGRQL